MIKHNHGYVETDLTKRFYTQLNGEILLIVKICYTDYTCDEACSLSVYTCKGIDRNFKSKIICEYISISDFRELNKFMRKFNTNIIEKAAIKFLNRFKQFNIVTNKVNNKSMFFCMISTNETMFDNCLFAFKETLHLGPPVVKERGFTKIDKAFDFIIKSLTQVNYTFLNNYYANMYQRTLNF